MGKGEKTLEQEETLQAVLVADSFNERFKPLTTDMPRCLMPLANVPLIEYTLEFLALSGVNEVIIICKAHSDAITEYIRNSRWNNSKKPRVTIVVSQAMRCLGDAMREMDEKSLLKSDFILVNGDVVANIDLTAAVEAHRQRRKTTDKNAILTMVLKQGSVDHRSRPRAEESVFMLDGSTHECIHWEATKPYPLKSEKVELDMDRIGKRSEILIYSDLIDCQIDICSVEVPPLFYENFDWQELRSDFLKGILESDILGKTVYGHLLPSGYATRVVTPRMYDAVSKDILSRWAYPIVPENNMVPGHTYKSSRPNIYKEQGVRLAIHAVLQENIAIGQGSTVGEYTRIRNSVIGRNCQIGANVIIEDAYIWDDSIIEDDCKIVKSILGSKVTLNKGVHVGIGSMIKGNVSISADTRIPKNSKVIGDQGADGGLQYMEDPYEDEDEDEIRNIALGFIGAPSPPEPQEADSDPESDSDDSDFGDAETAGDWKSEADATIDRAFAENHTFDIAVLELNTLKMAMNLDFHHLRMVVVEKLLREMDVTKAKESVSKILSRWQDLFAKYLEKDADQIDCIEIMVDFCATREAHRKQLQYVLYEFYAVDLLDKDQIVRWYHSLADATGVKATIRTELSRFMQWLDTCEEESESEDESEEESEDEEE
ncbi:nucleotide-diphospho-sugar transferase [Powellomyces hirtus]|nr:nucleotide-diphospho-sugar transferase [Powellomyces hirtus]